MLLLLWGRARRNRGSDRFARWDGLRRCQFSGTPVIDGGKLRVVLRRCLLMLQLRGHGRNALLPQGGVFGRQWPTSDASGPVVTGAVHRGIVDGAVIHVDVSDVDIVDGAVIAEAISSPVPALIAHAAIAEAVVNAAIVADILAPKTVVEAIHSAEKSPISGRPQEAYLRRIGPDPGHPEVALRSVAPVSGRP